MPDRLEFFYGVGFARAIVVLRDVIADQDDMDYHDREAIVRFCDEILGGDLDAVKQFELWLAHKRMPDA